MFLKRPFAGGQVGLGEEGDGRCQHVRPEADASLDFLPWREEWL